MYMRLFGPLTVKFVNLPAKKISKAISILKLQIEFDIAISFLVLLGFTFKKGRALKIGTLL